MPVDKKFLKCKIRSLCKKARQDLSPTVKAELDDRITQKLLNLDEYKKAEKLLIFISKDIEVSTNKIIVQAFRDGKNVAVPKCNIDDNTISFYEIISKDDVEVGFYNLYEPKHFCKMIKDFKSSLCVVPGLAYDKEGFRIGFGKGYYDRFLDGFEGVSVGVCYSLCAFQVLPHNEFDRPVNILVTENKIFRRDNCNG